MTLLAALGCGLVAGVFFAFSTFVMRALARLPAAQGIAAMQSINITAINPPFMVALFEPDSVEGANLWRRYLVRWTAWNHIRTAAALAAAAALTLAR